MAKVIFTKDSNYNEMKAFAKEKGINPVGKSKEVLAQMLNEIQKESSNPIEDIQAQQDETLPKWVQENGFNFTQGEVVKIIGAFKSIGNGKKIPILENRLMIVEKPAKSKGKMKGYLLHEKTGEPQKVLITIGINQVQKMLAIVPEVTEVTA